MSEARTVAVEDLVFIHSAAIARYGGASGVRDNGSLEAAALASAAHRMSAGELGVWFEEHVRPL